MEFNEKLQELRRNKGLTQEELAQQLSLFRDYRKKYKTSQITPDEFKSILE